ncbi:hypothetical protein [Hymenobacter glacialis]|uniref:hypothetical protein n=1 Tax=Hymenobacter glacialis TaxID=1908236 RepID=UPI001301842D|nr:hypothetical protein [Hymenobacter glacialis]
MRADLVPGLLYAGQSGYITNTVVQQGVSRPLATPYLDELEKGATCRIPGPAGPARSTP